MYKTIFAVLFSAAMYAAPSFAGSTGQMPSPPPPPNPSLPLECTPDVNPWGYPSVCRCVVGYEYIPQQGVCVASKQGDIEGASPVNGQCQNTSGSVRFTVYRYQGGVAPLPDTIVYQARLFRENQLIAEITHTAGGASSSVERWPFDVNFLPQTKDVLSNTGNRFSGSESYLVTMVVKSAATGAMHFQERMQCESSWNYLRP